jgi:hypothetical protein
MNQKIVNNRKRVNFANLTPKLLSFKYKWLIYVPILFITIFVLYLIFTINMPVPDPAKMAEIEAISHESTRLQTLYKYFRELVASHNARPIKLFTIASVILIFTLGATFIKLDREKCWIVLIIVVLIVGFLMRFMYTIYTDAITERQHDTLSIRGAGHYHIILSYFKTNRGPEPFLNQDGSVNFQLGYQFYHPRFSHRSLAMFMKFMRVFLGSDEYVLYQSTRILLCFTSCLTLIFAYKTTKLLFDSPRAQLFALLIIAFSPIFYRLSAMTNNDNFATLFTFIAIYYAIKWWQDHKITSIIGIALGIGLGMASKMSVALFALPIALLFLYILFIEILKAKNEKRLTRQLTYLLASFAIFAVIVFPLGLYYPIKHLKEWGQPITFVYNVPNQQLSVQNTYFFDRFLSFSLADYFKYPYVRLGANNPKGQDYNIYGVLLKSITYGEFGYKVHWGATVINVLSLLSFLALLVSLVYMIITFIITTKTKNSIILFSTVIAINFIISLSYITFNIKHPATCTMDFRYVIPILLTYALVFGFTIDRLLINKNKITIGGFILIFSPILLYIISSCVFHFII